MKIKFGMSMGMIIEEKKELFHGIFDCFRDNPALDLPKMLTMAQVPRHSLASSYWLDAHLSIAFPG